MLYPIQNFQQFVPFGAQYVKVLGEQNGVYSVQYYIDDQGRNPAYHQGYDGLVLEPKRLENLLGEGIIDDIANNIRGSMDKAATRVSNGIGGIVGWALSTCGISSPCDTYYAVIVDASQPDEGQSDFQLVVIEGPAPLEDDEGEDEFPFRYGDQVEIIMNRDPSNAKPGGETVKCTVMEVLGVNSNGDKVDDEYRYVVDEGWEPPEDIPDERLNSPFEESAQQEPMNKLKDTTKVAGQNKKKLRKGDKDSDKDMPYDDYYAHGKDNRGAMRAPQSDGEKDFIDRHTKDMQIIDYPGSGEYVGSVTNKEIGNTFQKFSEAKEDEAPLSSDDELFFYR